MPPGHDRKQPSGESAGSGPATPRRGHDVVPGNALGHRAVKPPGPPASSARIWRTAVRSSIAQWCTRAAPPLSGRAGPAAPAPPPRPPRPARDQPPYGREVVALENTTRRREPGPARAQIVRSAPAARSTARRARRTARPRPSRSDTPLAPRLSRWLGGGRPVAAARTSAGAGTRNRPVPPGTREAEQPRSARLPLGAVRGRRSPGVSGETGTCGRSTCIDRIRSGTSQVPRASAWNASANRARVRVGQLREDQRARRRARAAAGVHVAA